MAVKTVLIPYYFGKVAKVSTHAHAAYKKFVD